MADGNRDGRRRFGRRGRGGGERREEPRPALPELPPSVCGMCGKQIFDLSSAMAGRGDAAPVHFDCALAQASAGEPLGPNEKVAYIGRGGFAVIEFRDRSQTSFVIKRRISWEKEGEKLDWRKMMQQRMGI